MTMIKAVGYGGSRSCTYHLAHVYVRLGIREAGLIKNAEDTPNVAGDANTLDCEASLIGDNSADLQHQLHDRGTHVCGVRLKSIQDGRETTDCHSS